MRLESRIKKLEESAQTSQDVGDYDDRWNYVGHHLYYCEPDGKDVQSISLLASGDQYQFDTEEELWSLYPAGTKFRRSGGGNFEVIDGVMRELKFPPPDRTLSPETEAAIAWLFEEYPN